MHIIRNRVYILIEYKSPRLNSRDKIRVEILSIIVIFLRIHWILSNGE